MSKNKKTIEITPEEVDAFVDAFSNQFKDSKSEPENEPEDEIYENIPEPTSSNLIFNITESQFELLRDIYDDLDSSIDDLKDTVNTSYDGTSGNTSFGFDLGVVYAELRTILIKVDELVDAIEENNNSFVNNDN